jgi:hypothetical protein
MSLRVSAIMPECDAVRRGVESRHVDVKHASHCDYQYDREEHRDCVANEDSRSHLLLLLLLLIGIR